MKQWQENFIEQAVKAQALQFGKFKLKSGITSSYFFNIANFYNGTSISVLAASYASLIMENFIQKNREFDTLFGAAYKGIPLVAIIAYELYKTYGKQYNFCFNRKETKLHAEGGDIVGKLQGKVLIIDDVLTKGTALKQTLHILQQHNCKITGLAIAVDRQEKSNNNINNQIMHNHKQILHKTQKLQILQTLTVAQQLTIDYDLPIAAIVNLENLKHHSHNYSI